MTANLLFATGTLAAWTGAAALAVALVRKERRGLYAAAAGVLLLFAATTPAFRGGFGIPLVWPLVPFAGWAFAFCAAAAGLRLAQALYDRDRPRLWAATLWALAACVFVWGYDLDPGNRVELLRGRITLGAAGAVALAAFVIAALRVMAHFGRRGTRFAIQTALLAGCVVFGLPFLWLIITSFKEDRDLASANGLVWIPRVQRTVPYLDPTDPLLEGVYRGDWIQATVEGHNADGSYYVEVQRPASLRGISFSAEPAAFRVVPRQAPVVSGAGFTGFVTKELDDGRREVQFLTPATLRGQRRVFMPLALEPVRDIGPRLQNYIDALEAMPPETRHGLVYLENTLILVVLTVIGTLFSSSLVAFGFARLRFPGDRLLFKLLLSTMMLPGVVTLMPQFLLFRWLGWIDTLYPLWVPAFFGSAFNVFLLRQFFSQIPTELEDAGRIDGAGVLAVYWRIMLPQIKPALAVVAIWTFMGAWNNFMGPLIYVNSPENMPLSYALQLFQNEQGGQPALMMAFATMAILPVVLVFFFAQRYFIEGVTLSGLGGR